jgi:hypothetical protein
MASTPDPRIYSETLSTMISTLDRRDLDHSGCRLDEEAQADTVTVPAMRYGAMSISLAPKRGRLVPVGIALASALSSAQAN